MSSNVFYYHSTCVCILNHLSINWFSFFLKFMWYFFFFIIFFPLPFSSLMPTPPHNHHTVVHVHESFFLFAQSLYPYPLSCHPALHLWVCLYFACYFSSFIRLHMFYNVTLPQRIVKSGMIIYLINHRIIGGSPEPSGDRILSLFRPVRKSGCLHGIRAGVCKDMMPHIWHLERRLLLQNKRTLRKGCIWNYHFIDIFISLHFLWQEEFQNLTRVSTAPWTAKSILTIRSGFKGIWR